MNEVKNLLIGVELTKEYGQLCYYDRKSREAVSVPMRVGTNLFRFPMAMVKLKGREEWRVGYEAEYFLKAEDAVAMPNPYLAALDAKGAEAEGRYYEAEELLAIYLKELLRFLGVPNPVNLTAGIGIVCESLTENLSEVIRKALLRVGFRKGQCFIADVRESFYYYGYSQKPDVCARGMALIRFYGNEASFSELIENRSAKPCVVQLTEEKRVSLPEEAVARDEAFSAYVEEWTAERSYSGIFLTGTGFGTEWAKASLKTLSRSATHVFEGDNLFPKGACLMAYELTEKHALANRLYLGPQLLHATLGIDIRNGTRKTFLPLLPAGRSCFDGAVECDLILEEERELVFKTQRCGEREYRTHTLSLEGVPERPARTTRLHLTLSTSDENHCHVLAEDLGFGELFPASHLRWETDVEL